MSDIRRQGGEGLHGWTPVACLAVANDRIKSEPFGPYMRCVRGECECNPRASKLIDPQFGDTEILERRVPLPSTA